MVESFDSDENNSASNDDFQPGGESCGVVVNEGSSSLVVQEPTANLAPEVSDQVFSLPNHRLRLYTDDVKTVKKNINVVKVSSKGVITINKDLAGSAGICEGNVNIAVSHVDGTKKIALCAIKEEANHYPVATLIASGGTDGDAYQVDTKSMVEKFPVKILKAKNFPAQVVEDGGFKLLVVDLASNS